MKSCFRLLYFIFVCMVVSSTASVFAESYKVYSPVVSVTAIPDGGTIQMPIPVGDNGIIGDISVHIDIPHDDPIELQNIKLIAPDTTSVTLIDAVGCGGSPGLLFMDFHNNGVPYTAWDPPSGPCVLAHPLKRSNFFQPYGDMGQFKGKQMQGTWYLEVSDSNLNGTTGTVLDVELSISTDFEDACNTTFDYIEGPAYPHRGVEDYAWTFCPGAAVDSVIGIVNTFDMVDDGANCAGDRIRVYDGDTIGAWYDGSYYGSPLIDTYCATNEPVEVVSTSPGGCLTFVLHTSYEDFSPTNASNEVNSQNYSWNIELTCDACGNGTTQSREECDGSANCTVACECTNTYHPDGLGNCVPDNTCSGGYLAGESCVDNDDCTVGQCSSSLIQCTGELDCDDDVQGKCTVSNNPCFDDTDCSGGNTCQGAYVDSCVVFPGTCGSNAQNGACRTYPGTYLSQPASTTANGCLAGTYSEYADTPTTWRWQCIGINGGTTANCPATRNYCGNGTYDAGYDVCENTTNCDNSSCTCSAGYTSDGNGNCVTGAVCGNGDIDPGEQCDTSAGSANCQNTCECIDAYTPSGYGTCVSNDLCGNGQVDTGTTVTCTLDASCSNNTCLTSAAPYVSTYVNHVCSQDSDCMGFGYYSYCENNACVHASTCHVWNSGGTPGNPATDDLSLVDCSGNPNICGVDEVCVDLSKGNGLEKRCLHQACAATCNAQGSTCRERIHDHLVNISGLQEVLVGDSEQAYIAYGGGLYDIDPGVNNTPTLLANLGINGVVDIMEYAGDVYVGWVDPGVSFNMKKLPIGGGTVSDVVLNTAVVPPAKVSFGTSGSSLMLGYLGIDDILYIYEYNGSIWFFTSISYDLSAYNAYNLTDISVKDGNVGVVFEHKSTGSVEVWYNGTLLPSVGNGEGIVAKLAIDSIGNIYVVYRDKITEYAVVKKIIGVGTATVTLETLSLLSEGLTKIPDIFVNSQDVLYLFHQDLDGTGPDSNGSRLVDKVVPCSGESEECDGSDGCSKVCTCESGYIADGNGNCVITCGNGVVDDGSSSACVLDRSCGGVPTSCDDSTIDGGMGYFSTGMTCTQDSDCFNFTYTGTGYHIEYCHSKNGGRCASLNDECFSGEQCVTTNDCNVGYSCISAYNGQATSVTKTCVQDACVGVCPSVGDEECDDGNTINGDGCNEACLDEECVTTSGSVGGILEQIDFFSFGKKTDIGDINGDSINDIIIGAVGDATSNGSFQAALMIYKNVSPYVREVLNIEDTAFDVLIAGDATWLGSTVQNMLDLYDDGFPDIHLSAYYDASTGTHGSAWVVYRYIERVCTLP